MRQSRRLVAALLLAATLFSGCSASGSVGTEGDGVKVEGDVDEKK